MPKMMVSFDGEVYWMRKVGELVHIDGTPVEQVESVGRQPSTLHSRAVKQGEQYIPCEPRPIIRVVDGKGRIYEKRVVGTLVRGVVSVM
jgi:hypothetical protein